MSLTESEDISISGHCDPRFDQIKEEFARNFSERDELGASVCVIHEGRTVVDLWGGFADADRTRPWLEDTIVVVFSCTKGATALCAHMLASRGDLDLDAAVASYWPAFAQNGKAEITVRMLLNHQAGLPGLRSAVAAETICDFDCMVALLETEEPFWRPGTRHGYHALTFGWLVGEVIRRVTGETVGTFFRRVVAEPLGLDFWIGLPRSEEQRVAATVIAPEGASMNPAFVEALAHNEPLQIAVRNCAGDLFAPGGCDAPGVHAAEIPAANGIANARALAGMYAPLACGGCAADLEIVTLQQLVQMGATESAGSEDAVTFEPARYGPGFEKAAVGRAALLGRPGVILSEAAFGHCGLGGAIGFADPQARFSFGYAMNRHPRAAENPTLRFQVLIDAAYQAFGYQGRSAGKWA